MPADRTASRRFWTALGLILLAAAGLRAVYVLTVTRYDEHLYDATYYELQARAVADGDGFRDPFALFAGDEAGPAADHPPLLVVSLLPAASISDSRASELAMRATTALLGLAAVALTGVLGRTVAGDRVGLVAAGIAAVSANFWMNDGLIMAESLAVTLTALALWLAYRARVSAGWYSLVALGAVCGLAALTRPELALLAPLLVVPVAIRRHSSRATLVRLLAGGGAALLVVLPWVAYNQTRFDESTWLSTNDGVALAGANCDATYHGELLGNWDLRCLEPTPVGDQSVRSAEWRSRAFDYMGDHAGRLPVVVAARVLRSWQLWDPFAHARVDTEEGRPEWASMIGILTTWVLVPFGIGGIVVARRRRIPMWPLLVPIGVVTLAAALVLGQVRYRAPAEPSIAVLGAVGIVALVGRVRPSWALRPELATRVRETGAV